MFSKVLQKCYGMKVHGYAHSPATWRHALTDRHVYTYVGESEDDKNGKKNGATLDVSKISKDMPFPRLFHARTPSDQGDVQGTPEPFRMQPGEVLRLVSFENVS
jgi:hypothetical protein